MNHSESDFDLPDKPPPRLEADLSKLPDQITPEQFRAEAEKRWREECAAHFAPQYAFTREDILFPTEGIFHNFLKRKEWKVYLWGNGPFTPKAETNIPNRFFRMVLGWLGIVWVKE